jgi:3-carboxy-cis,cis-muconate cycloisomerase
MGNVFGSAQMRAVFDSRKLLQSWLDCWAALAEAEAEVGVIPRSDAERIRTAAHAEDFDLDEISRNIDSGRHILMPALRMLSAAAGESGKYVHWGATTNDITDTGLVLQMREALALIQSELEAVIGAATELARTYRDSPMAARTHWQHALPITFGLKVAQWIDELDRHKRRIEADVACIAIVQIGGGGGTLASLGKDAAAVQHAFAARLGLRLPNAPWYTLRDRTAAMVSDLGLLAATIERINMEIGRLSATEIGEVSEGQTAHQVGSSTMPQKINPINSERVAATCKLIRGLVPVMQGAMLVTHERDASAMTSEWLLIPQAMIMTHGSLQHTRKILERLQVFPDAMADNLGLTQGGIVAEAVMYALARTMGRDVAHDVMHERARMAAIEKRPLIDVLVEDERVGKSIDETELRKLVDPLNHLGLATEIVDRVLAATAREGGEA